MIGVTNRGTKFSLFLNASKKAIVNCILSFSVIGLLISCAEVKVQKVPTPTQYDVWTDEMQNAADSLEGFRFYLPRPFISVFESFPIHADVFMVDGIVSPDGRYVLLQIPPKSHLGTILGKVGMEAKIASLLIKPADVDVARAMGERLRPQAGEAAPPLEEKPEKPSVPAKDKKTGIEEREIINDNSAFAYQPLRGNMDIVYLPDFDEQYVVSSKSRLGNVSFGLNLGQGWSLQGFNSLTDNSALNDRIYSLIDEAQKLAFQVTSTLLGLPPLPPGTADVLKPQAGETLPPGAPGGVPGTPVSVKITIVHYAAKGLYPVIKAREINANEHQIDIGSGKTVSPKLATKHSRKDNPRLTLSHSSIPIYPYQLISFNTFQYLAFELVKPDTAPFNYLYDKTGTAGDPGDRRAADVGNNNIPGSAKTKSTNKSTKQTLTPGNELIRTVTEKLAAILNQDDFGEVAPTAGAAKFRISSADVVEAGKIRVKVEKVSGDPSDDLTPDILTEVLVQRAKELGADGSQKEMLFIDNFEDATGISPQADEVARPSIGRIGVAADPVAKGLGRWEVRMIQAALCLPPKQIDGIWGVKTAKALQRFQKEKGIAPPDGRLTGEQRQLLLEMKTRVIAENCGLPAVKSDSVASQLSSEQITAIQLALCLTGNKINGSWTSNTKEALRRYQIGIGAVPADGILKTAQRDKLLNFNGAEIASMCGE